MQTFQVKITRTYTDMNGVIIDKSLVPVQMQKKVPFYLFNKFDKNGGFLFSQRNTPIMNGMFFLYSYVKGTSYNFLDLQLGNEINKSLRDGDMIIVLADDPILPNFLCHIIMHSDYVTYGSFVENMGGKKYKVSRIQYVTDNEANWIEQFHLISINDFGHLDDNQLQPMSFRNPYEFTFGLLDINIKLNISDKQGVNSYMLFTTDAIELTFYVEDIETLENNNNNNSQNGKSNSQTRAVLYEVR